jgi:hypothetical protein
VPRDGAGAVDDTPAASGPQQRFVAGYERRKEQPMNDTGTGGLDPGFEPQLHSTRMRRTSEAVFQQIIEEGLLSTQRFAVYQLLYNRGPLTGREVNAALGIVSGHKRLSELQRRGVVEEAEERECTVTRRTVIAWDVTDALPTDPPKRADRKPARPVADDLRVTLGLMRTYWKDQANAGTAPPEAFNRTMRWLASLVPPKGGA